MANNVNMERQEDKEGDGGRGADVSADGRDVTKRLLPAAVSSCQDGERAAREGLASEQERIARRKSTASESRHGDVGSGGDGSSPAPCQRAAEEPPRLNFHIPRKNKERKALFQHVSVGSREFEDLMNALTSCYRDCTSAGTFTYTKARLVHSELLEKEFIEKKRELRQDGRTDKELQESFCFLLPDSSKLHSVCEKGLSVGHSRITTLGNPTMGVYLSKYSDLLQMNPFDPGTTGDIIIFKVMKGRVKSIYENISKNVLDPTPKFDCHVSKNAAKVISLRSYRAFELTQQYFYEYSFDEIKSRPRHVCPYAVVSFVYKGKEATPPPKPMAPLRSSSNISEGPKGRSSYTLWNGQLLNGGKAVFQASLQSSSSPFLPIKLPEKLEIGTVMSLEQVKRKIPAVLFSWSTYCGAKEVLKSGMYCSLFEVVDRSRHGNSLTVLLHKLERERMVFVNKLMDRGFLFILSSAQMITANERRPEWTRCLQALFLFQEPRGVSRSCTCSFLVQSGITLETVTVNIQFIFIEHLFSHSESELRTNPPADLSAGVLRQAWDYLSGRECGSVRLYYMNEYNQNLDDRDQVRAAPRKPHSKERACLRSYLCCPGSYLFAVRQAQEMMESHRGPPEYSPVSDWEGSDSQPAAARSNGTHGPQLAHADNDPEKMKELLRLIQMCKRNLEGEVRQTGEGMEGIWDARGLKRKLEIESTETAVKYLRGDSLDNGEHSRDETQHCPSFTAIMNSVGLRDTDLRRDDSQGASRLMKILASINKSTRASSPVRSESPSSLPRKTDGREGPEYDDMSHIDLPAHYHFDLPNPPAEEDPDHLGRSDYLEEQTAGSMSSLEVFSPCSSNEQHRSTELSGEEPIPWVLIPITGIMSPEKNAALSMQEDEENADDLHYGQFSHGSSCTSPKRVHCTFPQPANDDYTASKGGEEAEEAAGSSKCSHTLSHSAVFKRLDSILDEEFSEFSLEIHDLLKEEHIRYNPEVQVPVQRQPLWTPAAPFSAYISGHVSPGPFQSYISTLREHMSCFVGSEIPPVGTFTASVTAPTQSPSSDPASVVSCTTSPSLTPAPASDLAPEPDLTPGALSSTPSSFFTPPPKTLPTLSQRPASHSLPQMITSQTPEAKGVQKKPDQDSKRPVKQEDSVVVGDGGTVKVEPESMLLRGPADKTFMHATDSAPPAADSGSGTPSISSLISQLKPEVFTSLVEIIKDVQKNAVKFYIHSGEEESDVCVEIKEYLMRLGNVECNPQSFLQEQNKNNLDKLLIIIPNVDIAAHVHKIPALVSLKKLPSVSFAGVDSLDDVKNHTYNELFISGGFIVSDEFVLNPEFITCEKLQALLKFLEEQSTPENLWQWKVHCKTQKKLKELGRLNSDALSLLNLLTTYQKRHLVEFLPYHECDAPSRHAPDLNCLVRLQAHHTQHRHIIFLTVERRFEMFPHYSNNGIIIASIDDFMSSFHSLTGFHDNQEEVPSTDQPSAPVPTTETMKDECVDEEDMSLDSEEESPAIEEPGESLQDGGESQQPPPPQVEEFQPPLPDQPTVDVEAQATSEATLKQLDFEVLKTAITNFKASGQTTDSPLNFEAGGVSPGAFNVNPHQSFLCPTSLQTCFPTTSGPQTHPVSPSSNPQEQENKAPASSLTHSHTLTEGLGEASLAQLPSALTLDPPAPVQPLSSHSGSGNGPEGQVGISSSKAMSETGVAPPPAPANQDHVAMSPPGVSSFQLGGTNSREDWQQVGWGHPGGLGSASGTPTTEEDEAPATGHYATPLNSVSGTPNSQGGGKQMNPDSSTPNSQGSFTPMSSTTAPSREASKSTGLLPTPRPGHINGRGRGVGICNHSTVVGAGPPLAGNRSTGPPVGTFRGVPSNGTRPMPRHGLDRRSATYIWGFPRGRGVPRGPSLDFAQGAYSWRESYYHSQGEGYHTHRNDYNGW
ncbi:protein TASOR-like isoform X3 [Arapaima gigas]